MVPRTSPHLPTRHPVSHHAVLAQGPKPPLQWTRIRGPKPCLSGHLLPCFLPHPDPFFLNRRCCIANLKLRVLTDPGHTHLSPLGLQIPVLRAVVDSADASAPPKIAAPNAISDRSFAKILGMRAEFFQLYAARTGMESGGKTLSLILSEESDLT